MSNHLRGDRDGRVALTGEVVTGKAPLALPLLTSAPAAPARARGCCSRVGRSRPRLAAENVIVPVAGLPPVRLVGVTDTAVSDGPARPRGVHRQVGRARRVRDQAVICTIVSGAAAFVVIGNVADVAPLGRSICCRHAREFGSELNRSTVVAPGSGNASSDRRRTLCCRGPMEGLSIGTRCCRRPGRPRSSCSNAAAVTAAMRARRRMGGTPCGAWASVPGVGGGRFRIRGRARRRMLLTGRALGSVNATSGLRAGERSVHRRAGLHVARAWSIAAAAASLHGPSRRRPPKKPAPCGAGSATRDGRAAAWRGLEHLPNVSIGRVCGPDCCSSAARPRRLPHPRREARSCCASSWW